MFLGLPDRPLPVFHTEDCPHCGVKVWHLLSRVDPESWTDEAFRKEFDIDEVSKRITRKAAA
jgi:hypothetical protein